MTGRVLVARARLVAGRPVPFAELRPATLVVSGLAVVEVDGGLRIVHVPSGLPLDVVRCASCTERVVEAAVGSGVDWAGSLARVVRDGRFRVFREAVRVSLPCRRPR